MEIREKLQKVFRNIFNDESLELSDEMTVDGTEDGDSFMHVNLIVAIEQEFNIKFTIEEVMKVKNVGEFIVMIKNKKK